MQRMKIGRTTILNPDSIEYKWIQTLTHDGISSEDINASIQRCLGGDAQSADLLRRVAIGKSSPNQLLTYLDQE